MDLVTQSKVEQYAKFMIAAGWEWCGAQEAIPPRLPELVVRSKTGIKDFICFDPESFDPVLAAKLFLKSRSAMEKKMTLKEKLFGIYERLAYIDKAGENTQQHYNYVRAADVTNALRKQLLEARIYAEINFDFVGEPFTIARAKEPNAPFSAVRVKCSIVFHDLDSVETLTTSGLGTGCDNNDKSAYKAQTGALKYALKNAGLVPDEQDPEADESVDDPATSRREPEFREKPISRPSAEGRPIQPQGEPVKVFDSLSNKEVLVDDLKAAISQTTAPESERGDAYEGPDEDDGSLPTDEQMGEIRKRFSKLGDDLSSIGHLRADGGLKAPVKLRNFLQHITGAEAPKFVTMAQWNDFFARVDAAVSNSEVGFVGLAKLVNRANGIEEKK